MPALAQPCANGHIVGQLKVLISAKEFCELILNYASDGATHNHRELVLEKLSMQGKRCIDGDLEMIYSALKNQGQSPQTKYNVLHTTIPHVHCKSTMEYLQINCPQHPHVQP